MPFFQHGIRMFFLTAILKSHQYFQELISTTVPDAYLDEVFHVPQAQRYWDGKWTEWDPKITTPPALYLWSYALHTVRKMGWALAGGESEMSNGGLSTAELRYSNALLLPLSIIVFVSWTFVAGRYPKNSGVVVLPREFVMTVFPLLFFFSGLYYTDLFSALSVVLTCIAWEAGNRSRDGWKLRLCCQFLHLAFGLIALASRQTNVFWVAVFLGGLQVVESVKRRVDADEVPDLEVHDVEVGQAWLEDYLQLIMTLIINGVKMIPSLVLDLWPQLALLITFGSFVVWNEGVVLGDKSNHVATIHTPQMLYIWPFITFFSWPVMLPYVLSTIYTASTDSTRLRQILPRFSVFIIVTVMMALAVHFNTIVHPFTLADNRHYTFYVFRLLVLRPVFPGLKYAVAPIYAITAWLVMSALATASLSATISPSEQPATTSAAGTKNTNTTPTSAKQSTRKRQEKQPKQDTKPKSSSSLLPGSTSTTSPTSSSSSSNSTKTVNATEKNQTIKPTHSSFLLIWLISTTLSLISAPLVEPRYFILPWLIWRLHVPYIVPSHPKTINSQIITTNNNTNTNNTNNQNQNQNPTQPEQSTTHLVLKSTAEHAAWIEMAWYVTINIVSVYMFLHRGFEWVEEEPGVVQRFMW